jgi:hypothetical protein
MKVRDPKLKKSVDVYDKTCLKMPCYLPQQDPGHFNGGVGESYRSNTYLCGRRERMGCPNPLPEVNS